MSHRYDEDRKWIRQYTTQEPHFAPEMNKISASDEQKNTFFTRRFDFQRVRSLSVGSEGESSSPVGSPQSPIFNASLNLNSQESTPGNIKFYKELKSEFDFK